MLNKTVKIVPSKELSELKLENIAGQIGKVVDKPNAKGYWVKMQYPYFNEVEWYIPTQSIVEYEG